MTLHIGKIIAHQTYSYCSNCEDEQIYKPTTIQEIVPHHANFGYDIIEYIGRATYQRYRTAGEICEELLAKNIVISESEVNHLARQFVIYLALAHADKEAKLKEKMQHRGGYLLHIDGTTEGGSSHLVSALDELSRFVLASVKMPSESSEHLIPMLGDVKEKYGMPLAVVSDMGKGILLAVKEVFTDIPHFICHFHFLRDIGKDLLEKEYAVIRNALKRHGVSTALRYHLRQFEKTDKEKIEQNYQELISGSALPPQLEDHQAKALCYGLIHWALDGKKHGNGYGFPFDTPHWTFYKRLSQTCNILKIYSQEQINMTRKARKIILRIINTIYPLIQDEQAMEASKILCQKKEVFNQLRKAMRITLEQNSEGLNDNGKDVDIKTIEQGVKAFRNSLSEDDQYQNNDYKKMLQQIDKYWEMLWADPITINTEKGRIEILPQRTNNILEQFFRSIRRSERRKTGNNSISKRLQTMIAETPLVKNLENEDYMKVILEEVGTLAECFSKIDRSDVIKKTQLSYENQIEKIPMRIKKSIREKDIPELFLDLTRN